MADKRSIGSVTGDNEKEQKNDLSGDVTEPCGNRDPIRGTNIYVIIRMMLFGSAALLADVLFLVGYAEDDRAYDCWTWSTIPFLVLRIIFTVLNLDFMFNVQMMHRYLSTFKCCNFNTTLVRFGLLHVLSTNLCTWGLTVVMGAAGTVTRLQEERLKEAGNHTAHEATINIKCSELETVSASAAPYLFPFIIEFSIIAAVSSYKCYTNVGTVPRITQVYLLNSDDAHIFQDRQQCHFSPGAFFGICLFLAAQVILIVYHLANENGYDFGRYNAPTIYYSGVIPLMAVAAIFSFVAMWRISRLHYIDKSDNPLDEILLVVSLGGRYFFVAFFILGSLNYVHDDDYGYYARLGLCGFTLGLFEATVQFMFVMGGLRRCTVTRRQVKERPGEEIVVFLIWVNFAMWSLDSFTLRNAGESKFMRDFYGELGWILMANLTLPLSVFYRFHTLSLLSDIKIRTYYSQPGACCKQLVNVRVPWVVKGHTKHG